jgi:hypothetical protein
MSSCKKDEVLTGSLKVTYINHPLDLAVFISPAENSALPITDWIKSDNNGTITYDLNAGNYILTSTSSTYFPKVGFQIKAGETTKINFDSTNEGHVLL